MVSVIETEVGGKACLEWSLGRMRPRKSGAPERDQDNFFMVFCPKGEQRIRVIVGGECRVKTDFFLFCFISFCFVSRMEASLHGNDLVVRKKLIMQVCGIFWRAVVE